MFLIVSQTVETIRTKLGTQIHLEPRFALGKLRSRLRSQRHRRKKWRRRKRENGGAVGVQRDTDGGNAVGVLQRGGYLGQGQSTIGIRMEVP